MCGHTDTREQKRKQILASRVSGSTYMSVEWCPEKHLHTVKVCLKWPKMGPKECNTFEFLDVDDKAKNKICFLLNNFDLI